MRCSSERLYKKSDVFEVNDLKDLCLRSTEKATYPLAQRIESNVPIYSLQTYEKVDSAILTALQDEWSHILLYGPGVYVVENLFRDKDLLDQVNGVFAEIINQEKASNRGDHFSASGGNQRIWNSFSKHALLDPQSFSQYYSNPWLALICESWLGPAYRITAQVNIVNPGGAPQVCHRDYHLGFQTETACAKFPRAVQVASQLLTLQGAVAHTDMPAQSGPTRLLPFSQLYEPGYMAYRRPEFVKYFNEAWVSAPLQKGDGIFFNPALFHAAGQNNTKDHDRSANLLQISSAFSKPMETIETIPLIEKCWDFLQAMFEEETYTGDTDSTGRGTKVSALINAIADGYPFPTNLDHRIPRYGGLAPETEQEVLVRCLRSKETKDHVLRNLRQMKQDAGA